MRGFAPNVRPLMLLTLGVSAAAFWFCAILAFAGNGKRVTFVDGTKSGTAFLGLENRGICSAGACFGVNELQFGILANASFDKTKPKDAGASLINKLVSAANGQSVTIDGFENAEHLMAFLSREHNIAISAARAIQGPQPARTILSSKPQLSTNARQVENLVANIKTGNLVPATINQVGQGVPHRISIVGFSETNRGVEELLVADPNYPDTTMRVRIDKGRFMYDGKEIVIAPSFPTDQQRKNLAAKFGAKTISEDSFRGLPGLKKRFVNKSSDSCLVRSLPRF